VIIVVKRNIVVILLCFLFGSCAFKRKEKVPNNYVLTETNSIQTKGGITYVNNKIFSGWLFTLFSGGDTSYVQPFLNGKEHGIAKRWYANKQMEEERHYVNGKKEGIHTGWWETGQRKFEYHFVNDLYEGEVKEWYATGKPYKVFHYTKGQENGLQRVWESNGKIRSNYEIKNGRLFGLMGPKPCASLWENDTTVVQSH
jgi:antitoxin component YwqK of YwqJK toxin-antitoxin module